jgi:MoaA/NifB/PqqE/SkfB family radical SAM enzyme
MKYILGNKADLGKAVVFKDYTMRRAIKIFEEQKSLSDLPALLVASEDYQFYGIMTEKDIEKYYVMNPDANMNTVTVEHVYNKNPKYIITEQELECHKKQNTDPFDNLPPSVSFMPLLDKNNRVVRFVYNLSFYKSSKLFIAIDLNDVCQLRCVGCPRGLREMKNTPNIMSLTDFEKIVDKAKSLNIDRIELYNWGEPLLINNLYQYVEILEKHGIRSRHLGSNFSFEKIANFDKLLSSGFTQLYVSVSGFTQNMYEKYHRGGNVEFVKRNLEYAAEYKRKNNISGNIWVRYLNFGYNSDEAKSFEDYAKNLNILFENRVGMGSFNGNDVITPNEYKSINDRTGRYLNKYHEVSYKRKTFRTCNITGLLTLDYNGDVYLCCNYANHELFKVGNFLSDSLGDIMINKYMHPFCELCNWEKSIPFPENIRQEILKRMEF